MYISSKPNIRKRDCRKNSMPKIRKFKGISVITCFRVWLYFRSGQLQVSFFFRVLGARNFYGKFYYAQRRIVLNYQIHLTSHTRICAQKNIERFTNLIEKNEHNFQLLAQHILEFPLFLNFYQRTNINQSIHSDIFILSSVFFL